MQMQLGVVNRNELDYYRPIIIREYSIFRKGLSQAEKAQELHQIGFMMGWTTSKPMTGFWLRELGYGKTDVQKWIVKSALTVLFNMGWSPKSDKAWALFIMWYMYEKGPFFTADDLVDSLPAHFDKADAEKWTLFFKEHLGASDKTQMICYLEDPAGNKLSNVHISVKFLLEEAQSMFPDLTDRSEAEVNGVRVVANYVYLHEVEKYMAYMPQAERDKILRKRGQEFIRTTSMNP